MHPKKPQQTIVTTVAKRCACGAELKNDTYGSRCEDCYVDGLGGSKHQKPPLSSDWQAKIARKKGQPED